MRVYCRKAQPLTPGGEPRVCLEIYMTKAEARLETFKQPLDSRADAEHAALEEHLQSGHKCQREVKGQ